MSSLDRFIREKFWIDSVKADEGDMLTWAGHFSQQQEVDSIRPQAEIGISPVFPDKITDPALLAHIMRLCKKGIEFLNPGQTPVLGGDRQVYTLLKQL